MDSGAIKLVLHPQALVIPAFVSLNLTRTVGNYAQTDAAIRTMDRVNGMSRQDWYIES